MKKTKLFFKEETDNSLPSLDIWSRCLWMVFVLFLTNKLHKSSAFQYKRTDTKGHSLFMSALNASLLTFNELF